jgi:hypothetical protein
MVSLQAACRRKLWVLWALDWLVQVLILHSARLLRLYLHFFILPSSTS